MGIASVAALMKAAPADAIRKAPEVPRNAFLRTRNGR
jgi:hypothetical protein